jgi:hypothetical protein
MAFLFKGNGMINRLLLHHVWGHYLKTAARELQMHAKATDMLPGTELDRFQGRYVEWSGFKASFEQAAAGFDTAPYFVGEPDDSCQSEHWGYLIKGELLVRYKDQEETISAGEAYYLAPGHNVLALEDVEMIEFTPKKG